MLTILFCLLACFLQNVTCSAITDNRVNQIIPFHSINTYQWLASDITKDGKIFKRAQSCSSNETLCSAGNCCPLGTSCGMLLSDMSPSCCKGKKDTDCVVTDSADSDKSSDSSPTTSPSSPSSTSSSDAGLICPSGYDQCAASLGNGCCKPGANCYVSSDGTGKCSSVCTASDNQCSFGGCCPSGYKCDPSLKGCSLSDSTGTSTVKSTQITASKATKTSSSTRTSAKWDHINLSGSGIPNPKYVYRSSSPDQRIKTGILINMLILCGGVCLLNL